MAAVRWLRTDVPLGTALIDAIGEADALRRVTALLFDEAPAAGIDARAAGRHVGLLGLRASAVTVATAYLAWEAARRGRGPLILLSPNQAAAEDAREDFTFLLGAERVARYPEPSVPPYGFQIPSAAVRAGRIETLARLLLPRAGEDADRQKRVWVVLATPDAFVQRMPLPSHFRRYVKHLQVGQRIEMEVLTALLVRMGYRAQSLVGEYGDFSRRGGIVDIYSFGRENPVRVEFDDDEIASLREFDVFTQRSLEVLPEAVILPMWEATLDEEDWARAEQRGFIPQGGPLREHLDQLRGEGSFEGVEWMLAGFGVPLGTLLDFAGDGALVVAEDPVLLDQRLNEAREEVRRAAPAPRDPDHPIELADEDDDAAPLEDLFSPPAALYAMEGTIGDLIAACPAVYVGLGAQRPVAGETARERVRPAKGWSAGEQLAVPDPLDDATAEAMERSPEWRAMVARRIGAQAARDRADHAAGAPGEETNGSPDGRLPAPGDEGPWPAPPPIDEPATQAGLLEADIGWSDQAETSALLAYTTRHFALHTRSQEHFGRNLDLTRAYIDRLRRQGLSVSILCDTAPHRDRLAELMEKSGAEFLVGNLAGGFEIPELRLAVLTDHEIFQRSRHRHASRRFSRGISLKELLAMQPGDFVVHIEHGIGVYRGIERLLVDGHLTDCMKIEYAGGDKLFIPVEQLSLVQKYAAEEGARPPLSKLGSQKWERTKQRVKKAIKDIAAELIALYAQRKAQPGHAYAPDTVWQTEMEARFPYDETPDQLKAIDEVKADMEQPVPMDRLICGDVGYGKTEVAIRAAFKSVMDGKQVAFLVPTTLLAEQHFTTFTERLRGYPVRIDMLSRFRARKEQLATVADLKGGKVDIVVGTHRLLSKDVAFKDLGLVIVDEEQRFGVTHKERLKRMRTQVDVLTLTATPIPRTMNLALMGARDMSTIATPPRDRRPIQTEICEFKKEIITYALMREADRGGQCFFVHNRVESIDAMANFIRGLVPHLRVVVAHGQMQERQLEEVMRRFLNREYDVLVSTMIIESGLDLPNVNTIIVNRTDTFGLAQLYQLRGRVGRSARKAYAYLLVPPNRVMTENAMKRLKAIEEFEDLGSGFQLAMRDLEIRGAGNLLGSEQHGFIVNVGFDLYTRLVEEATSELRGVPVERKLQTQLVTTLEAFLPRKYVENDPEKMNLYKGLADADTVAAVDELAAEVIDRFGRMPKPAENLFELRRLRVRAAEAGVEKLILRDGGVVLELRRELTKRDVQRLIRQMPVPVTFKTHGRHRVEAAPDDVRGEMLIVAGQILDSLSG